MRVSSKSYCSHSKCHNFTFFLKFLILGVDKRLIYGYNKSCVCGRSSSGRARPCQGRGSEFEPRRPLHKKGLTRVKSFLFCFALLGAHRQTRRFPPAIAVAKRGFSSKSPRFICHRQRFGDFLVVRSIKKAPAFSRLVLFSLVRQRQCMHDDSPETGQAAATALKKCYICIGTAAI